jgi:hypothetical protein
MAKKFNLDTIKEMQTQKLVYSILYLLGALVLLAIGAMVAGKGGGAAVVFGFLIAVGGAVSGYTGYNMIIDTKNAKTCNAAYWNEYKCVANAAGTDADSDLNITECMAQTKAQYEGLFSRKYAGVWLRTNTTNTSNVDAFYIPADKETLDLTSDTSTPGARLFIRKAKADGDDDKGVVATGSTGGCAVTKSLGSIVASSPSAAGVTLKLSGVTGLATTDNITLTIVSTASPLSSTSSPIVNTASVATLTGASGYIVSNQSMTAGTYKVTASHTGVSSSVSTTFTV